MEWRDVVGFEGYYEVSDTGLVRSLDRYVTDSLGKRRMLRGTYMKQSENKRATRDSNGYFVVNLHKHHIATMIPVHRLVAKAFVPNPNCYPTVNHIDGDKHNNDCRNLEWASYAQNNVHALETRLRKPRGTHIGQIDKSGSVIKTYRSVCEASRETGIGRSMIPHCVNGRAKSAGGFLWVRIEKCNDYPMNGSTLEDELPAEVREPHKRKI